MRLAPPKLSFLGYCYDLGQRELNLDALVLEEGTDYGPVVALGNPKDPMPPYGAARGYFHDEDWQSAVARLAEASSAIRIRLDDTEGVWWEVDHIAANNMLQEKTLFLIHPRYSAITENQNILHKVAQRLALSDDFAQARSPQESVIGFFIDGNHSLKVAYSDTFSRVAFLMIMRWLMDKIYCKGGKQNHRHRSANRNPRSTKGGQRRAASGDAMLRYRRHGIAFNDDDVADVAGFARVGLMQAVAEQAEFVPAAPRLVDVRSRLIPKGRPG